MRHAVGQQRGFQLPIRDPVPQGWGLECGGVEIQRVGDVPAGIRHLSLAANLKKGEFSFRIACRPLAVDRVMEPGWADKLLKPTLVHQFSTYLHLSRPVGTESGCTRTSETPT